MKSPRVAEVNAGEHLISSIIDVAIDYASLGRVDDAMRETNLSMLLWPDDASVLYNAACALCRMNKPAEAMDALRKARNAGFGDANWTRRDPDLALLHGNPEFDQLYPEA